MTHISMARFIMPRPSNGEGGRSSGGYRKRRRPLNLGRIKATIVFLTGTFTALISGLTGLGAQVMFAPMLTWMLGFGPDKAQGTAMSFAGLTAMAAVAGAVVAGATPTGFVLSGVMLVVGAIVGAVLVSGLSQKLNNQAWRRVCQTFGIMIAMGVVIQVSHASGLFAGRPNFADWHSPGALLLLGLGVGAATQIIGLTSGALLVPTLYFLSGLRTSSGNYAAPAIALSLFVIAVAAVLPTLAYARKELVDATFRTSTVMAALVGGFCGGLLLTHIQERIVIIISAVVAMFLCARELSRLAAQSQSDKISSGH